MIAVTKLIDILNKPALVSWANNIGLKGVNLKDYRKESTTKGTVKHEDVENFLIKGIPFNGSDKLKNTLLGFELVGCEVEAKTNNLIGRIDLVLTKDSKKYVIDFKTSKYIYLSTKLQLSTYKHMISADEIGVIDLTDFNLTILDIDTIKYYTIIKRLYQINELLCQLKEKL